MISHSKPSLDPVDISATKEVLESGMLIGGGKVKIFENDFSELFGQKYVKAVNSGTLALVVALKSLNIEPGDEVILPTYVCDSVYKSVKFVGAHPVLCDIGEGWSMSAEMVAEKITKRTKAIIVVHLMGIFTDLPSFVALGIPLIEDCCQALRGKNRHSNDVSCSIYSFHPTKCMTTGCGGMIATNDESFYQRANDVITGSKFLFQMTDIQAALGISQLKRYESFLNRRKEVAAVYLSELNPKLTEEFSKVKANSMFFRFLLNSPAFSDFDTLRNRFGRKGIQVRRGVDSLLHEIYELPNTGFENSYRALDTTLSIPIYPSLTDFEIERVIQAVNEI